MNNFHGRKKPGSSDHPCPPARSSQQQRGAGWRVHPPHQFPSQCQVFLLAQPSLGVASNCNMQNSFPKIYLFARV